MSDQHIVNMQQPWELQHFLFEKEPTRGELRAYRPQLPASFRCVVYRNHSFELVEHTISAYLDFAGLGIDFTYSDYDDSLSFLGLPEADLILLWLDCSRYRGGKAEAEKFVRERVTYLRGMRKESIILVTCGVSVQVSGVICWDMEDISEQLGTSFYDERLEKYSGTKLSAAACTVAARELGCRYIPSALCTPLKGIVLDMDHTLYSGVLGEDGVQGVLLTPAYRTLQEKLVTLAEQGFFLTITSKNDARDVTKLWDTRSDFPLKKEMFSKVCVGWESKAESIRQIASFLNIGIDSLLFIDDNIGELINAKAQLPKLHVLHAQPDAAITLRALTHYPRLWKSSNLAEDALRAQDAKAREKRETMRSSMSAEDYLRSLDVKLDFYVNERNNVERISELSRKTNQFIFSYARYSPEQIQALMDDPAAAIISVHMSDKLADSGCIGVVVGCRHKDGVELQECFVSCRALGRGLDEVIVLGAIIELLSALNSDCLRITFHRGERNEPAARFVQQNLSQYLHEFSCFSYSNPYPFITTHTHYA